MKIERINDSQIRCTLSNFDLSERNLNLSELAYGSEKARRLFREMVQKASQEVGFEADDIPLMVEAIPLSNESVMLVITKVDDPEEMDTRFSRFAPSPEGEFPDLAMDPAETGLEGAAGVSPIRDREDQPAANRVRVFTFGNLDRVIEAAKAVTGTDFGTDALFKNPQTGTYFLVLKEQAGGSEAFTAACNTLAEYGTYARQNYSSASYYSEHYEVILKEHAIVSLKKI